MKKYSTSLIIREMQIKATVRVPSLPSERPPSITQQTSTDEDVEKREPPCTDGGIAADVENSMEGSLKN